MLWPDAFRFALHAIVAHRLRSALTLLGIAVGIAAVILLVAVLIAGCACCVLTGIGIGTFVSTLARSATQSQLMLFFVNPPLMALSGAFTPIEAMPKWIQPFSLLNPIAHFATLARSVLVRGSGFDVVYVHLLALILIATVLVGTSAWRFRGQLS